MAEELREIDLDRLVPGRFQPRTQFDGDKLRELAASIRVDGVLQPLLVRPDLGLVGQFEIIAGERRWRAAGLAGLHTVPCRVKVVGDEEARRFALIENLQRVDLNPIEEAEGIRALLQECHLTQAQVAENLGKKQPTIANALRLLDGLDKRVQDLGRRGELDGSFLRELLRLPVERQLWVALECVNEEWKRDRLVSAVDNELRHRRATDGKADPDVRRLERRVTDHLGSPARVEHRGRGGKLVIQYTTLEELDGILKQMRVPKDE